MLTNKTELNTNSKYPLYVITYILNVIIQNRLAEYIEGLENFLAYITDSM